MRSSLLPWLASLAALTAALTLPGCSGSVVPSLGSCTAGNLQACVCTTGDVGIQVCSAEGTFLACICGGGVDAGHAGSDGGEASGDAHTSHDGRVAGGDSGHSPHDATVGCIDAAACGGLCGSVATACGVVECGGCPSGETCSTDNTCAAPGCMPSCTSKACGASDGCGGHCEEGSCGSGLHCVAAVCTCDDTSCSGCCAGDKCKAGTSSAYCGTGGGACVGCSTGTSCSGGSCEATCTAEGGGCTSSSTCCPGTDCEGSVCSACGGVGAGCGPTATVGCCADGTVSCEGPNQTCCGLAGTACSSPSDCCGDQALTCGSSGTCVPTSSTGPGITCGSATCTIGTEYCCDGRPPEFETELQCDALPTQECTIATLECDDQSDCPTGQFCCAVPSQPDELVQWASACSTTCAGGTTGDGTTPGERLCNPNAAVDECASIPGKTGTCKPWIGIDQTEYACDCGSVACYP